MARFDAFQLVITVALLGCLLFLGVLLVKSQAQQVDSAALDKTLDQQIAYQARIDFLLKLYQPVEDMRADGRSSDALLLLDELARRYPQEAHGEILRGEILLERQAVRQAIQHFVQAVRLNGDYVDKDSPLTRRSQIQQLVDVQLPIFVEKSHQMEKDPPLQQRIRDLYYLQGRLAGGCE